MYDELDSFTYYTRYHKKFVNFQEAIKECVKMSNYLEGFDEDLIAEGVTDFSNIGKVVEKYYDKYCKWSSFARETDPDISVGKINPSSETKNNEFNLKDGETTALQLSSTFLNSDLHNLYKGFTIFENEDGTFEVIYDKDEDVIPIEYTEEKDSEWAKVNGWERSKYPYTYGQDELYEKFLKRFEEGIIENLYENKMLSISPDLLRTFINRNPEYSDSIQKVLKERIKEWKQKLEEIPEDDINKDDLHHRHHRKIDINRLNLMISNAEMVLNELIGKEKILTPAQVAKNALETGIVAEDIQRADETKSTEKSESINTKGERNDE